MAAFLSLILAFPVAPLTVLLGICLCYWLFVLLGVVGFDADGAADAAAHGAVDGAVDGAADGLAAAGKVAGEALGGATDGAADAAGGALKGVADAVAGGAKAAAAAKHAAEAGGGGLLAALGLGGIPVTITGSAVVFFAWVCAALTARFAGGSYLMGAGLLGGSLVAALLVSAAVLRPLNRVFATPTARGNHDAVGQICEITSSRVDARFGTATLPDGGAGLLLDVVSPRPNTLSKGDRALVVAYDPKRSTYEVEALDWLLPEEREALKDPARAASVIAQRSKVRAD